MKVNKEEILGMYVALEKFINLDHAKLWKTWEDRIAVMENSVKKIPGVTTSVIVPPVANRTPTLIISWDKGRVKAGREELISRLRDGSPSVTVMGGKDESITITSWNLLSGQEKLVAARLSEEFTKASG